MPRFKSTCPDLEHRDKIIVISFLVVENNNIVYFRHSTSSSESKIDINLYLRKLFKRENRIWNDLTYTDMVTFHYCEKHVC